MLDLFKKIKLIHLSLILSAASGLMYEVVATNILFFYFVRSTYSVSTVLSVFMFGLGLGSFLIYKFKNKIKNKAKCFANLQILIGLYGVFVLGNLTKIIPTLHTFGVFFSSFFLLLIPTTFLGAVFPLAGHIIKDNKIKENKHPNDEVIGLVYSIDLIGAVSGSLLAGFYFIPNFGNHFTIISAAIINFISAFLISKKWKKVVIFILVISAVFLLVNSFSHKDVDKEINENLIFQKASPYGEIMVEDNTLYIDGRDQCSLNYPEETGEKKIVEDSLKSFNSKNLNVLNVGLGCGLTLESILEKVDNQVDIVEINPVVVEANNLMSEVLEDHKVNLIIDEGLNYLRNSDKKYDAIIIDIENSAVIHASDIYTEESFKIIKNSLKNNGVFGLWVNYCDDEKYYDIIYNTLSENFDYIYYSGSDYFISSNVDLGFENYVPKTDSNLINYLDKKVLSKHYFDNCKWWIEENNILNIN